MRSRHFFIFLIASLSFFSCSLLEKDDQEDAAARVYDKYLSREEVETILGQLDSEQDSSTIISNYINQWLQQELLLEKAELNLREDQKDFQKLLEDYRRSLIIYAYQREYIRQNLDTIVSDQEISQYYKQNEANFELKENIVKMRFVKVTKDAPKLNKLEKMIQKEDDNWLPDFREYCLQYAVDYNENDSIWITFDKVIERMPLQIDNEESFLRNRKFVVKDDSLNYYLLYIREYKIKNAISPLSFEKEKIRNIIINQRKLALISSMKGDLLETALQKGNVEIFEY